MRTEEGWKIRKTLESIRVTGVLSRVPFPAFVWCPLPGSLDGLGDQADPVSHKMI